MSVPSPTGPVTPAPASTASVPEVTSAASVTNIETRSEAAGSDRRDVDMMGPPTGECQSDQGDSEGERNWH